MSGANAFAGGVHMIGERAGASLDADESAGALAQFQEALMFELVVRLGDGVGADDELFGEGADARKLIAVLERAGFGSVTDLLHQLEVEGLAAYWGEFEEHAVLVEGYSDTAGSVKAWGCVDRILATPNRQRLENVAIESTEGHAAQCLRRQTIEPCSCRWGTSETIN